MPFDATDGQRPSNLADRLTVEALRLALCSQNVDAEAVAQLAALADGDELAIRRALRRIEHGGSGPGSIGGRAAECLRHALTRQ